MIFNILLQTQGSLCQNHKIIDSKSSVFNPSLLVSLIKAKRLILSFPFRMKLKNYLLATYVRSLETWTGEALDINLGMANDLTTCILPIRVNPLHFYVLNVF